MLFTSETDMEKRRIQWEIIILACMYVGYMAFLLCRTALPVAGPQMVADKGMGLNKTLFGQILAWGTAGMVMGKLVNGTIADWLGGRKVFILALAFASFVTIAFGWARSYASLAALNFLMLFAAAAGWPAMSRIISSWYSPKKFGRVWGIISTSSRLSATLSMLFLGMLLAYLSWQNLFRLAGFITFGVFVVIFFFLKAHPSDIGLSETKPEPEQAPAPENSGEGTKEQEPQDKAISHELDDKSWGEALLSFALSLRCWLMCLSLMCTTVLMEFIGFIPLYLTESFPDLQTKAGSAASAFPAGCLVALIVGGFIYDGVSRKGRIGLLGGLLAATVVFIALLWALPHIDLPASWRFPVVIAILFMYGLTVAPAYYIPMSIFSIEFGGKRCGLLIGLIDATGYAASMVYQSQGGKMVDNHGWSSMLQLLFLVSLAATIITIWFTLEDYKAFKKRNS